jgi:hypothetical protein
MKNNLFLLSLITLCSCKGHSNDSELVANVDDNYSMCIDKKLIEELDTFIDRIYDLEAREEEAYLKKNVFGIVQCQFIEGDSSKLRIFSKPYYDHQDVIAHSYYRNLLIVINSKSDIWKDYFDVGCVKYNSISPRFLKKKDYMDQFPTENFETYFLEYYLAENEMLIILSEGYE